jgi:chromosome segregation ATPase
MIADNLQTVEELDARIAEISTDLDAKRQRQQVIETEIADRWDADNTALETEYAGLTARINAGQRLMTELQTRRDTLAFEQGRESVLAQILELDAARKAEFDAMNQLDKDILLTYRKLYKQVAAWAAHYGKQTEIQVQIGQTLEAAARYKHNVDVLRLEYYYTSPELNGLSREIRDGINWREL